MSEVKKHVPARRPRRSWKPPAVKRVGTVAEVLRGGGGKHSILAADSGDFNKPKGQG